MVQIQPRGKIITAYVARAYCTGPTRHHGLDHTHHEYTICLAWQMWASIAYPRCDFVYSYGRLAHNRIFLSGAAWNTST